jgi:hypothetical protein
MTGPKRRPADRPQVGHRTYQCNNIACPIRAWPDGTPRLFDETHFTQDGHCRLVVFRAEPWPNRLGHDVYENDKFVAEVSDDPIQEGVGVLTFDPEGEPEKFLDLSIKLHPIDAVLRCRSEGRTVRDQS